jgi:signal transduction histidine kinase
VEYTRKNHVKSMELLNEALTINAKLDLNRSNKEVLVESHYWLGRNHKSLNKFEEAKFHFNKTLTLSDEFNIRTSVEESLFELGELALLSKDVEEAIQILNKFKDSYGEASKLKNENARNLIKDVLQLRNIEKEALSLKAENQKKEDQISWLTYSSLLLLLIGVLLFTLLFNYFRLFQKSKEVQQLKSQFIAMAVHEFKNPIGIISSALELMKIYQEQIDHPVLRPKIEQQLDKITRQEKRLNSLVEDLMIFEELFMNKYMVFTQKFELVSFLKEIADDIRDFDYEKRRMAVESSIEVIPIWYDKILLHHLLSNVIGNAYKYSVGNPAPVCSIKMNETSFIIVVEDFGIGIPLSEQRLIFKEFFRASNVGDKKGSGIGLAIVKSILDKLNGKIDISSEVNKGTTLTLTLPYLSPN